MSVVKKYAGGGVTPTQGDDYNKLFEEEMKKGLFTSKGESNVRKQFAAWKEAVNKGLLNKDDEGNFMYYSQNPDETYTIKPMEGFDTSILTGNAKAIKPNFFGQLNLKSNEEANTWLANFTNKYLANKGTSTSGSSPINRNFKIQDLKDFIKEKYYGNQEGFENLFSKYKSENLSGDKDKIWLDIMQKASEHLNAYNQSKPSEGQTFEKINNYDALMKAINDKDVNAFKIEAHKLGWNPEELADTTASTEEKQADQEAKTLNFQQELAKRGINPENILPGFTEFGTSFEGSENYPSLQKMLSQEGITILNNPTTGKQLILKDGELYNPEAFTNPFTNKDVYGTYLSSTPQGTTLFTKDTEGYNKDLFKDVVNGTDIRPILGNVQGFSGWNIYGVPSKTSEGWNYSKRLLVEDPATGKTIDLLSKGDEGLYSDLEGKEYYGSNLTGYGDYQESAYKGSFEPLQSNEFNAIQPVKNDGLKNQVLNEETDLGAGNTEEVRAKLQALKYVLENKNIYSMRDQELAARKFREIAAALEEDEYLKNKVLSGAKQTTFLDSNTGMTSRNYANYRKLGGVLKKFQTGGKVEKLSPEEYQRLFGNKQTSTTDQKLPRKSVKNIRGTLKDMSGMQAASLIGTGLSVIPGLGVIGSGIATGADIIEAGKDGWDWNDAKTIGMDLGFMALSLIGAGGVGVAAKAAKLAKASKILKEESVLGKLAKESDTLASALTKISSGEANTLAKAGATADDIKKLKAANLIGAKTTSTTGLSSAFKNTLKESQGIKEISGPGFWGEEFKGVKNLFSKTPSLGKPIKYTFGAAGALGAGTSTINAASQYAEGGLGNVRVDDLKNSLYGISAARGLLKNKQLQNLANSIKTEGTSTATLVSGEHKLTLPKEHTLELPKFKKAYFGKNAKASAEETNTKMVDSFKENYKKLTGSDLPEGFDFTKAQIIAPEKTAVKSFEESGLSKFQYQRAKDKLENKISYFRPSYLGIKFKDGGVIKAQDGTTLPEVGVIAKNLLKVIPIKKAPLLTNTVTPTNKLIGLKQSTSPVIYSNNIQSSGSDSIKDRVFDWNKLKSLNKGDLFNANNLNLLGYLNTVNTNAKISKDQIRAINEGLFTMSAPGLQYVRTPTLPSLIYEDQVGKIQGAGNRLSSSISDIDKRANIMLATNKQVQDLRERGKQADLEALAKTYEMQQQTKAAHEAQATDIANKNKAMVAEAASKIPLVYANQKLANNAALTNLIHAYSQNKKIQEVQDKYKNYANLLNSGQDFQDQQDKLTKELGEAKSKWEAAGKVPGKVSTGTWEESPEYKVFTKRQEDLNKAYKQYSGNLQKANFALQIPYVAKGGTLAEKKELIRYRAEISRQQKEEEDFYKSILKNNEVLLKSLIKVFK